MQTRVRINPPPIISRDVALDFRILALPHHRFGVAASLHRMQDLMEIDDVWGGVAIWVPMVFVGFCCRERD